MVYSVPIYIHWRTNTGTFPVGTYLFKVNNEIIRTTCEICRWRRSGVFIVNFEQTSQIVLVFPLETSNKIVSIFSSIF